MKLMASSRVTEGSVLRPKTLGPGGIAFGAFIEKTINCELGEVATIRSIGGKPASWAIWAAAPIQSGAILKESRALGELS